MVVGVPEDATPIFVKAMSYTAYKARSMSFDRNPFVKIQ